MHLPALNGRCMQLGLAFGKCLSVLCVSGDFSRHPTADLEVTAFLTAVVSVWYSWYAPHGDRPVRYEQT